MYAQLLARGVGIDQQLAEVRDVVGGRLGERRFFIVIVPAACVSSSLIFKPPFNTVKINFRHEKP